MNLPIVSVPVRGMRDLYEDEVIEEKTEKMFPSPSGE